MKRKKRKKKATKAAEMTNENGGRNDRLKVRNGCYVCWIFFFFFSRNCTIVLLRFFWGCYYENGNETPPSTAVSSFSDETRSAVAGLRQSNSRCRTGTQRSPCEVECSAACVIRRGKNIRQPKAFLDLGRSDVFTERRQPRWLCEGATAEKIKGDRHDTAGMQRNGACGV